MKYLEDVPTGGLEKAKDILSRDNPWPEIDYELVQVTCKCGKVGKVERWRAAETNVMCKGCSDIAIEAARIAQDKPGLVLRLGGLKAYETFTLALYSNKQAIDRCDGFPDINLFLWGKAGVGKTHLATAIVRNYGGATVLKPQQIYRACRGLKGGDEEQQAINKYINMPYLVIDDLGVDKKTEFNFSILYEILDGRDMNYKKGLIITSNLSIGELAGKLGDDRIPSRIAGMCRIVELTGDDKRITPNVY